MNYQKAENTITMLEKHEKVYCLLSNYDDDWGRPSEYFCAGAYVKKYHSESGLFETVENRFYRVAIPADIVTRKFC